MSSGGGGAIPMTEEELSKFIKTVFCAFDRMLLPKEIKEYVLAWAPYVGEFDYDLATMLLPNVCLGKEFPPRPWEFRVALINYTKSITPPPPPPQAWVQYQAILVDAANGTVSNEQRDIHDALHMTLYALSGVGLNNQFDAKRFETLYEDKVKEWFKNTYWIPVRQ
jgi:hypothetical protein